MNQPINGFVKARLFVLLAYLIAAASCRQSSSSGVAAAYSGKDLFPDKVSVQYARGFAIEYHPNFKAVSVFSRSGSHVDTLRYLLVQRGTPVPDGYAQALTIFIPLQTMIGTSSMHVALADFAACTDILTGLENLRYVSSPAVIQNISKGLIKEVGAEGNLNNELVLTMHPDMVMVTENPDSKLNKYKTLTEAGIPVLLNAEWMETTPLGQAEWVKLMAALVNKEALVNKKFAQVDSAYKSLVKLGHSVQHKPAVITGMPYKGAWFVPKGDSFMAQFLRDAGASYKWANVRGEGNLALNFEAVAPEALAADIWLNTGDAISKKDLADRDHRYTDFRPYKNDAVYNNNNRMTEQGSNDYWESGAVNPQLVLADLIKIFHPSLLAGHQLVYYKQIK